MTKKNATASDRMPAPADLDVRFVERGGVEFAILSFSFGEVDVPRTVTRAEREIIDGVLRGESNDQIARARGRSPRTIANQLASIFKKFRVQSRNGLVAHLTRSR